MRRSLAGLTITVLMGVACSRQPAAPPGITVEGTLLEGYTGRPLGSGEVVLSGKRLAQRVFVATAKPDAGGRFRFDHVQRDPTLALPDSLFLGWKPPQGDLVFADSAHARSDYVSADLRQAKAGAIDLGTRYVWLESAAEDAFAPVCRSGKPVAAAPAATPVVVFEHPRGQEPDLATGWHKDVASAFPEGWKGVLCIEPSETRIGQYGSEFESRAVGALELTWKATLVRLPDGKVFRTAVTASPPKVIQVDRETGRMVDDPRSGVRRGNPMPKLQEWLRGLSVRAG